MSSLVDSPKSATTDCLAPPVATFSNGLETSSPKTLALLRNQSLPPRTSIATTTPCATLPRCHPPPHELSALQARDSATSLLIPKNEGAAMNSVLPSQPLLTPTPCDRFYSATASTLWNTPHPHSKSVAITLPQDPFRHRTLPSPTTSRTLPMASQPHLTALHPSCGRLNPKRLELRDSVTGSSSTPDFVAASRDKNL